MPVSVDSTMRDGCSVSWAMVTVSPSLIVSQCQIWRFPPGASTVTRSCEPTLNGWANG